MHISGHELTIFNELTGEIITKHTISLEKGQLIKNQNHSRDRSKTINQLKRSVLALFTHEKSRDFIEEICRRYGRYRRDQLLLLQKVAREYSEWTNQAIEKCLQEKLYSANEFRDVVHYLQRNRLDYTPKTVTTLKKPVSIPVQTRDLNEYIVRMGGK